MRIEMLRGGGTHDFDESPSEPLTEHCRQIFFPEGGATITEVRVGVDETNVLSRFSNTSIIKAGTIWAVNEGEYISYVAGTTGQINYNKA